MLAYFVIVKIWIFYIFQTSETRLCSDSTQSKCGRGPVEPRRGRTFWFPASYPRSADKTGSRRRRSSRGWNSYESAAVIFIQWTWSELVLLTFETQTKYSVTSFNCFFLPVKRSPAGPRSLQPDPLLRGLDSLLGRQSTAHFFELSQSLRRDPLWHGREDDRCQKRPQHDEYRNECAI